jgi:hypothetical protein
VLASFSPRRRAFALSSRSFFPFFRSVPGFMRRCLSTGYFHFLWARMLPRAGPGCRDANSRMMRRGRLIDWDGALPVRDSPGPLSSGGRRRPSGRIMSRQ